MKKNKLSGGIGDRVPVEVTKMRVFVKTLKGTHFEIEVNPSYTVCNSNFLVQSLIFAKQICATATATAPSSHHPHPTGVQQDQSTSRPFTFIIATSAEGEDEVRETQICFVNSVPCLDLVCVDLFAGQGGNARAKSGSGGFNVGVVGPTGGR